MPQERPAVERYGRTYDDSATSQKIEAITENATPNEDTFPWEKVVSWVSPKTGDIVRLIVSSNKGDPTLCLCCGIGRASCSKRLAEEVLEHYLANYC